MKKEHNATPKPEASSLSSCELALEDLELVSSELLDEDLDVVVGGVQRVPVGSNGPTIRVQVGSNGPTIRNRRP